MTAAANLANGSTDLSHEVWLLTKAVRPNGSVVCVSCLWRGGWGQMAQLAYPEICCYCQRQSSAEAVMQMSCVREKQTTNNNGV